MPDRGPISLDKVKSYPLADRKSLVKMEDFARPWKPGGSLRDLLESFPEILAGKDFIEIVRRIAVAHKKGKKIMLAMGAHVIKVGLSPVIIDLLERGVLSSVSMNGAGIIHDAELAMTGNTSEDVAEEIGRGTFGMAEETGRYLNSAILEGAENNTGLGMAIGAMLVREEFPFNKHSILARAYELEIPVTVHVAVGTDIIHAHPNADGAAIGKTSHLDFRIFSDLISELQEGVYINLGSAVVMPEVFLKAINLVRNLGYKVTDLTTVNMDFIKHYRPMTNVVSRPTLEGGKGFNLVGHHEIMFPLLAAALIEEIDLNKK
jgi:deoxyhypusine synthase